MMKKLLLILFCISPLMVLGQTPGNPTQVNNTNYYSFQNYMGAVQGFMLPQRDTNWTPSAPALVYRPADSSLYYWKWNKWQKVGGSMSSNDTSFSLYLLKTDFIDSLNNNRQTITRRNDSLFLTFGGSVSMVPDSTVFPTWYAINDSGYIKKETDPVFTSSPAYTITTLNINNWQTAYNSASTNGDTLILTSITGGVNKIPLLVSQDTTKFRGTGQGYGTIKTGNAKVYGDTLAYSVDTTIVSYPTSVHDSVMSFGNSHNITVNGSSTIAVTGAPQPFSNNPSFTLSANNTMPLWNANQLNGYAIQNSIPTAGQILYFNGSTWSPNTFQPATGITSLGMAAGYGMGVSSNTSNPITSYGTFTVAVDTTKIANLRYTDSALVLKKNIADSSAVTGYSTVGGLVDSLNKINGTNGWLYNPATKTGQVDSTKYSTVVATHDSIVANIPNLSIYTKYTDTSNMLLPYTKKGSNVSQFNNDANYMPRSELKDSLAANSLDVKFPLILDSVNKNISVDTSGNNGSLITVNAQQDSLKHYTRVDSIEQIDSIWNFTNGLNIGNIQIFNTLNNDNLNVGYLGQNAINGSHSNTDVGFMGQHLLLNGYQNDNFGAYGQYNIGASFNNTNFGFAGQNSLSGSLDSANINVGSQGQYHLRIGHDNINIGRLGQFLSDSSGGNISIGTGALFYNKTGSNNIAIGTFAGSNSNDSAKSNAIFIGVRPNSGSPDSVLTIMGNSLTRKLRLPGYSNYNNNPTNVLSTDSVGNIQLINIREVTTGNIRILKEDSTYFIRTKFTDTTDLIQEVSYAYTPDNQNKSFDFIAAYIIPNIYADNISSYISGTQIQNNDDDVAPLNTYENGYVGEGHGALLTSIITDSLKMPVDIGSKWKDSVGNYYYIAAIQGDTIIFYTQYVIGGNYSYRTFYPISGDSLTHISGGVDTTVITFTSQFYTQSYPIINNIVQDVLLDGNSIKNSSNGLYYCNQLNFINNYDIADLSDLPITNPFLFNDAPPFVTVSTSYNYNQNGSCVLLQTLNFKRTKYITDWGGIQALKLVTGSSYPNVYTYIPDSKPIGGLDYSTIIQTNTTPPLANFDSSYRQNHSIPLDRTIQFLGNSSGKDIGFSMGYFPDITFSSDSSRINNSNDWMLSAEGKSYPYILYNYQADSQIINDAAYRAFFPTSNDSLTYYYVPIGGKYYLFIDCFAKVSKATIQLPPKIWGKEITIYRSINTTLLTSGVVPSSGIMINSSGSGYIILKLE